MKKEKKHPLEMIKWGVIPIMNYRGCEVTKQTNGLYSIFVYKDLTAEEVDEIINRSCGSLDKSIKK